MGSNVPTPHHDDEDDWVDPTAGEPLVNWDTLLSEPGTPNVDRAYSDATSDTTDDVEPNVPGGSGGVGNVLI